MSCAFVAIVSGPPRDVYHAQWAALLSRRQFLRHVLAVPAITLSVRASSRPLLGLSASQTAELLKSNCASYISLIAPISEHVLLWRGAQARNSASVELRSPSPDLLDEDTYGREGANFFKALESAMLQLRVRNNIVLPSCAHIAVGKRETAAQWGEPVTIWPCGSLKYAYWRSSSLIYDDGDSLPAFESRGDKLIFGHDLRSAVEAGKEVMFVSESNQFYEVHEDMMRDILPLLT